MLKWARKKKLRKNRKCARWKNVHAFDERASERTKDYWKLTIGRWKCETFARLLSIHLHRRKFDDFWPFIFCNEITLICTHVFAQIGEVIKNTNMCVAFQSIRVNCTLPHDTQKPSPWILLRLLITVFCIMHFVCYFLCLLIYQMQFFFALGFPFQYFHRHISFVTFSQQPIYLVNNLKSQNPKKIRVFFVCSVWCTLFDHFILLFIFWNSLENTFLIAMKT